MRGVLTLITGWALLTPLLFLLASFLGFYAGWMRPFLDIAASIPLLGFFTLAGILMIGLGVRQLARQSEAPDPF